MSKIIISQKFDKSTLNTINNYFAAINAAALRGDTTTISQFKDLINAKFRYFDLRGTKNSKLQTIKRFLDDGINSAIAQANRINAGFPFIEPTNIPYGSFEQFAKELFNEAKSNSLENNPETWKSYILLKLNSNYSGIMSNAVNKENLFRQLQDLIGIDFNTTITTPGTISTAPSVPTESRQRIIHYLKQANAFAKNKDMAGVQKSQAEIDKIFGNQFDIFVKKSDGSYLNPKLRELYTRILNHFKKLKEQVMLRKNNPNYKKPNYKLPAEFSGKSNKFELFAKDIIEKAKSQLKNPGNLNDLRVRIEILLNTGHEDLLSNPDYKNILFDEIKKQSSIDLNKPVTASLKKLNKIIIALEKNNFIKEAEIVDKIFDKLTK